MRKSQSPYPVNAAALVAAEAAMRDRAFIARTVREVKAGRQQLERGLARLGVRYFPSGGNFVLVYFGDRAKKIVAALDRKGILVRDRSSDFRRRRLCPHHRRHAGANAPPASRTGNAL